MKNINNIRDILLSHKIVSKKTYSNDYLLSHTLTDEEFHEAMADLCKQCKLEPQNKNWFPGSPTDSFADYGYYIHPINPKEFEIDDFDMLITSSFLTYC